MRFAALLLGMTGLLGGCVATPNAAERSLVAAEEARHAEDVFALSAAAARAYRESRWIEAARDYRRLAERVPEDAYAWFRLGNTYAQQGAYARAIDAYERSIARDERQPKAWFNLATAYLLHAQAALRGARERLRPGDAARVLVDERLDALVGLVHERIEESVRTGAGR